MKTRILKPQAGHIRSCTQALKRGQLVAIPTETVYGLAGNARRVSSVKAIFSAKERPSYDPLIVHLPPSKASLDALIQDRWVDGAQIPSEWKRALEQVISRFWPGPLTLVLPRHHSVLDWITAGTPRVALRCPAHPLAQRLLEDSGLYLAAPSANRFGRVSPTTAEHVFTELKGRIPFILDGGPCSIGVESTVVALSFSKRHPKGFLEILRQGQIDAKELEKWSGRPVIALSRHHKSSRKTPVSSPGLLESHYAPNTPLFWHPAPLPKPRLLAKTLRDWQRGGAPMVSLLWLGRPSLEQKQIWQEFLDAAEVTVSNQKTLPGLHSPSARKRTAQSLFGAFRDLDSPKNGIILAIPGKPLLRHLPAPGPAILDRIWRAARVRFSS